MASAIRGDEETCVTPGVDPMKTALFWFSHDPLKNLKRDISAKSIPINFGMQFFDFVDYRHVLFA